MFLFLFLFFILPVLCLLYYQRGITVPIFIPFLVSQFSFSFTYFLDPINFIIIVTAFICVVKADFALYAVISTDQRHVYYFM